MTDEHDKGAQDVAAPKVRDESQPPPGWQWWAWSDDDGVPHVDDGPDGSCRATHWTRRSLTEAWAIYDAEHGYAPSVAALQERVRELEQDVAASEASLTEFSEAWQKAARWVLAHMDDPATIDALREELAAVTRERDERNLDIGACVEQLTVMTCSYKQAEAELAAARKRIAELEDVIAAADILTPEQSTKLEELLANPPEPTPALVAAFRRLSRTEDPKT